MSDATTLPGLLEALATRRPDGVAFRLKRLGIWRGVTWSRYLERVREVALALDEKGVGAGDRVAVFADNGPRWLYADLGIQALGAASVGVYPALDPAEAASAIARSGATHRLLRRPGAGGQAPRASRGRARRRAHRRLRRQRPAHAGVRRCAARRTSTTSPPAAARSPPSARHASASSSPRGRPTRWRRSRSPRARPASARGFLLSQAGEVALARLVAAQDRSQGAGPGLLAASARPRDAPPLRRLRPARRRVDAQLLRVARHRPDRPRRGIAHDPGRDAAPARARPGRRRAPDGPCRQVQAPGVPLGDGPDARGDGRAQRRRPGCEPSGPGSAAASSPAP